jgi:hypothetical protein
MSLSGIVEYEAARAIKPFLVYQSTVTNSLPLKDSTLNPDSTLVPTWTKLCGVPADAH